MRFFFILIFFFLSGVPGSQAELKLPEVPESYVSDLAGLLTPGQTQSLENKLSSIEKKGSSQVLVVTVPDLQGVPIEDYSIRLAEKWKPGHAGRDNGVILLVAPSERKVRIEVGYGLEGALTDALSKNIIETRITPAFRGGDFFGGIQAGIGAIDQAIAGEYEALPAKKGKGSSYRVFLAFWVVIFFLAFLSRLFRRARSYGLDHGRWHTGRSGWGWSGRRSGWGGSSGGFSGGFSSGGGGFGGGGASGSW